MFKGGPARVIRSSPQFGFTLLGYEVLKDVSVSLELVITQKLIRSPPRGGNAGEPFSACDINDRRLTGTLIVSMGRETTASSDCANVSEGRHVAHPGPECTEDTAGRARGLWKEGSSGIWVYQRRIRPCFESTAGGSVEKRCVGSENDRSVMWLVESRNTSQSPHSEAEPK